MKTSKYFLTILFVSIVSLTFGQEEAKLLDLRLSSQSTNENLASNSSTSFWRPFTIELNANQHYLGIGIEKELKKRIFARASFSSDFHINPLLGIDDIELNQLSYFIGYKFSSGILVNVLNFESINTSVRTGLEFGISQKPEEDFYLARVSSLLIETPILLEFRFLRNYSINFGIRPSLERYLNIGTGLTLTNGIFYDYPAELTLDQYHLGLRYTFAPNN